MSVDMLKFASELLQKGIQEADQEMINTARKILNKDSSLDFSQETEAIEVAEVAEEPKRQTIPMMEKSGRVIDINAFKMKEREGFSKRNGVPVNTINRGDNRFIDDMTLNMDITTPKATITKRDRQPEKKVLSTCSSCGQTQYLGLVHVRENFICDDCILNKRKGRK